MNSVKRCCVCKLEKSLDLFYKNKVRKDRYQTRCKSCCKTQSSGYYSNNKETITKQSKKYYKENKTTVNRRHADYNLVNKEKNAERRKAYYEINKDSIIDKSREYSKNRRKEDSLYRLKINLRTRLRRSIKRKSWTRGSTFSLYIGCSLEDLKIHLESQFKDGMTWENYGDWHIDHIIPLASAQTEEEIYKLNHYTNLQPLWALDNMKKGDKI